MNKQDFLNLLRDTLSGEVSAGKVSENIRYYDDYISAESGNGKAESEVIAQLGDPRLLAKTIIDMAPTNQNADNVHDQAGSGGNEHAAGGSGGFHANHTEQGWDVRYGGFKLNSWYGKLTIILVIVVIIFLVLTITGAVLSLVLPILIPVLLVLFILSLMRGGGRRK